MSTGPARPGRVHLGRRGGDGPIPAPYSVIGFGLAVAGTYDGRTFTRRDPEATTFYAELRPISDEYDPDALAVSGLDRDRLPREGRDPVEAMAWPGSPAR